MTEMTYRPLGDSGLVVSAVGVGCNAFGRRVDIDGVRDVLAGARDAGVTLLDTADAYGDPAGAQRGAARRGARGAARRVRDRDQVRDGHARPVRRGPRRARVAAVHQARGRGVAAPAPDRPHRPVPAARPRRGDPDRGDPVRAVRPGPRGQGPLPRLLQLRGLAGRRRRLDRPQRGAGAVRQRAEPLLAARPHRRGRGGAGVRDVRARDPAVLPAGVRPAHRQVPPRRARPGRFPRRRSTGPARSGWSAPTGTGSRPSRSTPRRATSAYSTSPSPASPPSPPSRP